MSSKPRDSRAKLRCSYLNLFAVDKKGSEIPAATRKHTLKESEYSSFRSCSHHMPRESTTSVAANITAHHWFHPVRPRTPHWVYAASFPKSWVPSIPPGNLTFINWSV